MRPATCGASVVLPCIAFATHLSVTHTGRCIQASLTLNLARADSNFCLQITFQWLHKSASSSSSSASFSLPLAILPPPPPSLPPLSHALFCVIPHFAPFSHQPHLIFPAQTSAPSRPSFPLSPISWLSLPPFFCLPITCFSFSLQPSSRLPPSLPFSSYSSSSSSPLTARAQ